MALAHLNVYLHELRRGRGFSQTKLAEAIGVNLRTVQRWENEGIQDFSNELVAAFRVLGGALSDAESVLAADATEETAKRFAAARLLAGPDEQFAAAIEGLDADDVLITIRALRDRPNVLAMVRAMLAVAMKQEPTAEQSEA